MMRALTDQALQENLPDWGVLVLESHHSDSFSMDWRTHPFFKLIYVLNGRGDLSLPDSKLSFVAGDVIVVAPGTRNRLQDDPGSASSLYICCIARSLLKFDPLLLPRLKNRIYHREQDFTRRVAARLRRMVHGQESDAPWRPVSMVADAIKLIQEVDQQNLRPVRLEREANHERTIVKQYIDSLPTRFFEETSIDAAAQRLGIPRRSFTKLFSELTGQTWLHFVRGLAIEYAQRRLQQTDLPVTSIAYECGFNDLSTFYRQFKQRCGVSPGDFRARHADQSPMQ